MGGGYTRKRKHGGGNDPSCGCDMQAGWPKSLTENIPLPSVGSSQSGGGSCGIPPIPRFYQGGGGCGCGGCGLLPQTGGGQPAAYNSNPVPDACPFPGTGYCGFYARGGSSSNENVPLGHMLMDKNEFATFLFWYGRPSPHHQMMSGKPKTKQFDEIYEAGRALLKAGVKNVNEEKALQWIRNKKAGPGQQGGANYGEPMNLQARLRGGGCGCMARRGGYRPTKKNLKALKRWRKGQSIGFTMTSSLKAKGLIPRTSRKHKGKKVVSAKYK